MDYDVIVVGGGTAGAAAAIKAGRLGAKTLVVESLSALGGTQSMGWVTPMMPNYLGDEQLSRGINLDIQGAHGELSPPASFTNAQVWYNPVALSLALDKLADDADVTRLYNTTLIDVEMSSSAIRRVVVSAKTRDVGATRSGSMQLSAKVYVDASGDAELAYLSGAPFESGDESGKNQPMTLRFAIGNVDLSIVGDFFGEHAKPNKDGFLSVGFADAGDSPISQLVADSVSKGTLLPGDLGYFQFFTMLGRPKELAFNCPRLTGFDPLDPFSVSKALIEGRKKIFRIFEFLRANIPGFEQSYVSVVAPLIGIRESRRILGEYVLTEQDHQSCRKFEDSVARNRYPIDIHLPGGGVELRKLPPNDYHEIPYRSLLPQGVDNLLVAGRCLSATFVAQSSTRIQPVCRATGEAAGAAAALCAAQEVKPRDLNYAELAPHLDLSVG